jgi:hypothetical protein
VAPVRRLSSGCSPPTRWPRERSPTLSGRRDRAPSAMDFGSWGPALARDQRERREHLGGARRGRGRVTELMGVTEHAKALATTASALLLESLAGEMSLIPPLGPGPVEHERGSSREPQLLTYVSTGSFGNDLPSQDGAGTCRQSLPSHGTSLLGLLEGVRWEPH